MYWTRTGSRWSLHREHCTHCQMGKVRQGLCWDYVVLLMPLKARLLGSPRVATSDWMLESSWEYYKASHQAPFADISWSWQRGDTLFSDTLWGAAFTMLHLFPQSEDSPCYFILWANKKPFSALSSFCSGDLWSMVPNLLFITGGSLRYRGLALASKCFQITSKI